MRWKNVFIRGIGAALGELTPVSRLRPASGGPLPESSQRAISIARGTTGMDLAVYAGRVALTTLAYTTNGALPTPSLHFHAAIWRGSRGIDFWSRAAYVRSHLGLPAGHGMTAEINAMSNSLVGGIDLSARILTSSPDIGTILLTGGETFGPPAFDHLTTDHGIAYGDGASAAILGRNHGLARIITTCSFTDPTLEQLHRGTARFLPPGSTEVGVEHVRDRKKDYITTVGTASVRRRNDHGLRESMNHALAEAGITSADLSWVLLPHYGHHQLETQCLLPLDIPESITLKYAGDQWGHIGPNDQFIGLTHLFAQYAVSPGDYVALVGIGIGMTWTTAVLQIEQVPNAMNKHSLPILWPWRSKSNDPT